MTSSLQYVYRRVSSSLDASPGFRLGILLSGIVLVLSLSGGLVGQERDESRKRIREYGVRVGVLEPGKWNAITDVADVRVGQVTLIEGQDIRTGVTAILPHGGNIFLEKVPGAIYIGNGFGKLMGISQVEELGKIETPILLTATLNVPKVADALIEYALNLPGMERVRSINPVVGETNDGTLNNIRLRPIGKDQVTRAIKEAENGPVEEGNVGAGTGTICYGFKGGIGTSSRVLPPGLGGFTVGVLVQTNFGGILEINGAPIGRELGRYYLKSQDTSRSASADGSCMIVVATDAPLKSRNLKRLAKRAFLGMASTGSPSTNGSGDYVIAFSTRRDEGQLSNDEVSPLFQAAKEATEEAIYNSLFMAESMTGRAGNKVDALPVEEVIELLHKHRLIEGE